MRLSVIIITLNEEQNLPRCLRSISSADPAGLEVEIVVADGGSTDATTAIAAAHGARVVHGARGIPQQRNAGARAASGDILAFVDADVELLPGWFTVVRQHFGEQTHFLVLGGPRRLAPDASWVARAHAMALNPPASRLEVSHDPRYCCSASLVLSRAVFEAVGGFREDLPVGEDTALVLAARDLGATIISDPRLAYIHYGEPRSLGEFFQHTLWRADYGLWLSAVRRRDRALVWQRRYLFGAVVAAELGALGASLLCGPLGWLAGVPAAAGALGLTFGLPALKTALRHGELGRVGELGMMYCAYGTALAAALVGAGRDKSRHFRRPAAGSALSGEQ